MEVKNESIRELSEHESTSVNGGIAFVIPPAAAAWFAYDAYSY